MKFLVSFVFLTSALFSTPPPKNPEAVLISHYPQCASNVIFLASFPRSGQNWMKCLLQIMGKRPIYPLCGTLGLENPLNLKIDDSKTPCFVMHNPHWIDGAPSDCNKLIVIVRDYKECFIREAKAHKKHHILQKIHSFRLNGLPFKTIYFDILEKYDSWEPSNRHLIYYEDLLKKPTATLKDLCKFLGDSQKDLQHLLDNFQRYNKLTIQYYNKRQGSFGGSMSRGKSEHFHSKQYPIDELIKIDKMMKEFNPYLWQKYLRRYSI